MNRNITILFFSGRKNGNCMNIGKHISSFYLHDNIHMICANHIDPCGNCDYECLKPNEKCPNLTDPYRHIMEIISISDLVYYVIPNFCGFPCANYFAFNERSVGYFNRDRSEMNRYMSIKKRFIIVSNSENTEFKTAAAQQTYEEPDMLYLKSSKYKKDSILGDILDSEDAKADLEAFLREYPF